LILIPQLTIAQPNQWDDISVYPLPELDETIEVPIKAELPAYIRFNCWAYVKHIYPQTPPTKQILANLGDTGEIGVLYYSKQGLYHYVVVIDRTDDLITFKETNYKAGTYSERSLPVSEFEGFYSLKK
jgi:hypothetical protein